MRMMPSYPSSRQYASAIRIWALRPPELRLMSSARAPAFLASSGSADPSVLPPSAITRSRMSRNGCMRASWSLKRCPSSIRKTQTQNLVRRAEKTWRSELGRTRSLLLDAGVCRGASSAATRRRFERRALGLRRIVLNHVPAILPQLDGAALLVHDVEGRLPADPVEDPPGVLAEGAERERQKEKLERTLKGRRDPAFGWPFDQIHGYDVERVHDVESARGQGENADEPQRVCRVVDRQRHSRVYELAKSPALSRSSAVDRRVHVGLASEADVERQYAQIKLAPVYL